MKNFFKLMRLWVASLLLLFGFSTNAWADWSNFNGVYMTISGSSQLSSYDYYSSDKGEHSYDLGTLTSDLKVTNIYLKYSTDWSDRSGFGGQLCYKIDNGDTQWYQPSWTETSKGNNNYEKSSNASKTIASVTGNSGKYTFEHWWQMWMRSTDYWVNASGSNYKFTYTILPPAIKDNTYSVSITGDDVKAGSGTEADPYIIKYGGQMHVSISAQQNHSDANSSLNLVVYKDKEDTDAKGTSLDIKNITNATAAHMYVKGYYQNGDLRGSQEQKAIYYQAETLYTVTVVGKTAGGTVSPGGDQSVGAYTSKTLTASNNTGYHFVDWTTTGGANLSTTDAATTTLTASAAGTVTANFAVNNYSITYDPLATAENKHFAYTTAPNNADYNSNVAMVFAPDANYVIAKVEVYKTGDATTKVTVNNPSTNNYNFTQPAYDVTIHVEASLSQVQVTYGKVGEGNIIGTVGGDNIGNSPAMVNGGSTVVFTATPTSGYKVVGFYRDVACESNLIQGTHYEEGAVETCTINAISEDASVYVKFSPITYTITYNENGGTDIANSSYTIESETITLPTSAQISKTNYTFLGWFDNSGFTGEVVTTIPTGSTGNKQYWAKWEETKYAVTLVGAKSPASPVQVGNVTPVEIVANDPTPGYYFVNWTKTESVTITNTTSSTTTIKATGEGSVTANFAERFYLRGSVTALGEAPGGMPGWNDDAKESGKGLFTNINGNTATITRPLEASTEYKLKLGDMTGNSWGGSGVKELTNGVEWQFTSHEEKCNAPTFRTAIAGTYTFTIDFSGTNPKIKIDYPEVPDFTLTVDKARKFKETTMQNFISGNGTQASPYQFYLDEKMTLTVTALPAVTGVTAYYKFGDDAESSMVLTKEITAANTTVQSIVVKTYYKGNIGSYTSAEKTETIYYQGVDVPALNLTASWNEKEQSELSEQPEVTIYYSADHYSGAASVTISKDDATATTFMTIENGLSQKEQVYQMADNNPHRYDFEATATVNERDFNATTSVSIYRLVEVRVKDTYHLMTKYYMWINGSNPLQEEAAWPGNDFIGKLGDWHIFLVKYPSYTHFVLNNGKNWGDQGAEQTEDIALPDHNTCYEIGTKYTEGTYQYKYKVTQTETCPDILYVGNIADVTLSQGESKLIAPEVDLDYGYDESQLQISFPSLPNGFTAVQQGKGFLLTGTNQCAATTINVTYTLNGYSVNKSFKATVTHPSSILIQVKYNPNDLGWGQGDHNNTWLHYWGTDINKYVQMTYKDWVDNQDRYYAQIPLDANGVINFQVGYPQGQEWYNWRQTDDVNNVSQPGCYTITSRGNDKNRVITRNGDYCWAEYQVKINMASGEEYESNAVEDLSKIVSFYAPGKNETGNKSGLVRIMRNGTQVAVVSADKFDKSGVYTAKIVDNGGEVSLTEVALYTGDYYIRTDGVDPDNTKDAWDITKYVKERTMTNFSLYDGAKYNYYWTKNVQKTPLNVKARVANKYNDNLAVMLVESSYTDENGDIKNIDSGTGVNLRFGYNPETNYFERAILRGSTAGSNDFLNIQGDNVFNDAACQTQELNESNYTSHPEWSKFNDVSDWVYEKLIYVKIDGSHPSASILLKSKDFSNNVMYQLGSKEGTPVQRVVMGQGTSQGTYSLRVIYDYKTNRLSATWEPGGNEPINTEMKIDADILFVSNEGGDVKQVTFGDNPSAKLTSLQSIMYVLELTNNYNPPSDAPDAQYWIALPFECKISDIFGVENYITLNENRIAQSGWWGIMRYRGDLRAEKGWFKEDTPEGFWEWMYPNESLEPGQGYVLYVEKKSLKWEAIKVEEPCTGGDGCIDGKKTVQKTVKRFYFPSLVEGFTMNKTGEGEASTITYPDQKCDKKGRESYDSNWKVIAPKSYNNITITSADNYSNPEQTTWPNFIYEYNPSSRTYTAVNGVETKGAPFVYHSFHGYMAQYAGNITWIPYSKTEHPTSAPRFAEEPEFKGGTMTIELVHNNEQLDHTFVQLNKFGTEGFDQNLDLTKITENCAQIASVSEDVLYAGNTLPLDIEMVPLNIKVTANGTYDIALEKSLEGLEVKLYDAFEQTTTLLDQIPSTVTLNKGEYKDRFFLQFVQKSPLTPTNLNGAIEQFNLPSDKTQKLLINSNIYLINAGRIYNASGTQVK